MSIYTAQIILVKFVAPMTIVPCITINKGIDVASRAGAAFDLPITLSYMSNGQTVTVNTTPRISATQPAGTVDPQAVKVNATISNAPPPQAGTTATCTVNITIKDSQNQTVLVFDPATTTLQFT
jgi:hypothetical protein